MAGAIELTGTDLAIEQAEDVALRGAAVTLGEVAIDRIARSRALIDKAVESGTPTYGVNTGFGRFVDVAIEHDQVARLQLNLLRSHACGVGDPFPTEVVRAAMLLRANALATGASRRPPRDRRAAAGAARRGRAPGGAVARLAGRQRRPGPARPPGPAAGRRGRWPSSAASCCPAPRRCAAPAWSRSCSRAKEGLALINGTQFMTAIGALVLSRAARLVKHRRPRRGAVGRGGARVAHAVLARDPGAAAAPRPDRLRGEPLPAARRLRDRRVAPLVRPRAGRLLAALHAAGARRRAATPSPTSERVVGDRGQRRDRQPAGVRRRRRGAVQRQLPRRARRDRAGHARRSRWPSWPAIAERRIERMVNPTMSEGLPPFLTEEGGLNSGFMIPHYVAASLVAENKVLAHPASVDSIPTSAGQEDHVSMGATAAVHCWQVCANVERVLAVELLCGAQGLDFLAPLRPGPGVAALHAALRERSPHLDDDRSLSAEIEAVAAASATARCSTPSSPARRRSAERWSRHRDDPVDRAVQRDHEQPAGGALAERRDLVHLAAERRSARAVPPARLPPDPARAVVARTGSSRAARRSGRGRRSRR